DADAFQAQGQAVQAGNACHAVVGALDGRAEVEFGSEAAEQAVQRPALEEGAEARVRLRDRGQGLRGGRARGPGCVHHSAFGSGAQETSAGRLVEVAIDQLYGLRLKKT